MSTNPSEVGHQTLALVWASVFPCIDSQIRSVVYENGGDAEGEELIDWKGLYIVLLVFPPP